MTTPSFAELLAPIARRELSKAYGSPLRPWRPLSIRDPTYFGRKRRARRARGRLIEGRWNPPYVGGRIWLASAKLGFRSYPLPRVMVFDEIDRFDSGLTEDQARAEIAAETERWRKLTDLLIGKPWEEQADV